MGLSLSVSSLWMQMVVKMARDRFIKEISFRTDDKDVSLAKVSYLVYPDKFPLLWNDSWRRPFAHIAI